MIPDFLIEEYPLLSIGFGTAHTLFPSSAWKIPARGRGYWFDEKNGLYVNGTTWKYQTPLGIPMARIMNRRPSAIRGISRPSASAISASSGKASSLQRAQRLPAAPPRRSERGPRIGFPIPPPGKAGIPDRLPSRAAVPAAIVFHQCLARQLGPHRLLPCEGRAWPSYFLREPHLDFGFKQ
jgi:hypothetical protein